MTVNPLNHLLAAAAVAALLGLGTSARALATVYNPATAFEAGWTADSNPNGVWSYGYSTTPFGALTLYDAQTQGGDSTNQQMWISSAVNCCIASPSIGYNDGAAFDDGNVAQTANQIDMVASANDQTLSDDLIFTAPSTSYYNVTADFLGDQHGIDVGVGIMKSGIEIFNSSVTQFGEVVPLDTSVMLNKGDTLEFYVTPGGGSQNTGLDLNISAAPEPTTWALMIVGLGAAGGLLRRRDDILSLARRVVVA